MKVLFLTLYPDFVPSSRFRIGQYLPFFRSDGFEIEVRSAIPGDIYRRLTSTSSRWRALSYYLAEFLCRTSTLLKRSDHDAVVLQKGILSFWLRGMERLLKPFQDRMIFDIDDAVYLKPPSDLPRALGLLRGEDQVRRVLQRCRGVVAANRELAEAVRPFNANVHIIPTPVDTEHFSTAPQGGPSEGEPFRLIWMGNRSGNLYVNGMAPVVAEMEKQGIKSLLTVVSDSPDYVRFEDFLKDSVRFVPWSLESEKAELAKAHAGVMPLADNPWNRAKSGFKSMIYMACGLPAVCAPVGSITEVIRHGENGFFAGPESEWTEILLSLARDERLRSRIGRAARRTVEEGYSVKVQYPRWKEILRSQ